VSGPSQAVRFNAGKELESGRNSERATIVLEGLSRDLSVRWYGTLDQNEPN
jgi:hypothetical protein